MSGRHVRELDFEACNYPGCQTTPTETALPARFPSGNKQASETCATHAMVLTRDPEKVMVYLEGGGVRYVPTAPRHRQESDEDPWGVPA